MANDQHTWFWDQLDRYLADRGLKQTKQRRLVVDLFLQCDDHVDAESLHRYSLSQGHKIGLATIYRTLNLLKDAKVVDEKSFGDGRTLYEVIKPEHHHDHLICNDCGEVVEFENEDIERLQHEVAEKYGFQLTSHRLDLYGQCVKVECPRKKGS